MPARPVHGEPQGIAGAQDHRPGDLFLLEDRPAVDRENPVPGQETRFLLPALVGRAVALRGRTEPQQLVLGNLSPIRDFLHVRDVVRAYISLCERGTPGEAYNVSSGIGRSVRQVAETILERVGVRADLVEDPALVRPVDVPSLVGDSRKLQRAIEWRATTSFDDLIDDLLHAATY